MEETRENADFYWNALSSIPNVALGRNSRNSPSYLRHHSNRTPRRDSRYGLNKFQGLSSQRVLFCLILITVWAYVGFHVQSNWAHGDHRKTEFIGYKSKADSVKNHEETAKSLVSGTIFSMVKELTQDKGKKGSESSERLAKKLPRKRVRRMLRRVKPKASMEENSDSEFEDVDIPTRNSSFGLKVGPFNEIEDRIIGLSLQNRKGKCIREEEFASLVWTRSFVLIFHELSMTGAPLSMMELSTEILNCGGNVKVVTLSKKGGLMWELARRGIEVIEDKGEISFKAAMKADLVIAGSAVSSSWIEQYLRQNPAGSSQLVWWIMENRREYFNRSKLMLSTVNTVAFLSNVQSKQWLSWCEEDKIKLKTQPVLVPLSVNDDLAFLAGIPCSLNTPILNVNKMMEKRDLLRSEVREKMGLSDNDMLVMTLSSINPTKGQLLLLEAVRLVAELNVSQRYPMLDTNILSLSNQKNASIKSEPHVEEALHLNQTFKQAKNMHQLNSKKRLKESSRSTSNVSFMHQLNSKKTLKISSRSMNNVSLSSQAKDSQQNWPKVKNLLSEPFVSKELNLKVLIGSVGSKSNKAPYVKSLLRFLSQHSNMSSLVLWTRTTARVASLYAAADVYVINAQGVGETFGRVTIEAMAFGLPVLGTDAGGTKEIVEDKRTGLLHPVGHEGAAALAKNIRHLMDNPLARTSMGMRGRQKVQEAFLKHHTYSRMAKAIANCLKARH